MPAPIALPAIQASRCTGCGWCVAACPWHLISLAPQGWQKKAALHDTRPCTGCSLCANKCPFGAIRMEVPMQVGPPLR